MIERQLHMPLPGALSEDVSSKIVHDPLHVRHSTFLGGMNEPVHRWFRLTPSFGPGLVREVLGQFGLSHGSVVLDPFAGAGTTLIECQRNDILSYGFELHPFLRWVAATTLNWDPNVDALRAICEELLDRFRKADATYPADPELAPEPIPPIHTPFRWWRPDVLRDLLIVKYCIKQLSAPMPVKDFATLALAGVLVPELTNVTLGRLQLHFIDRSAHRFDVWGTFQRHFNGMVADLELVLSKPWTPARIIQADSTLLPQQSGVPPIDCIITSPPYPNRYSYVWNTRPHLYLFDFFRSPREASDLDLKLIGGTWGTATSALAKGRVEPAHDVVQGLIQPLAERIRVADNLMANYVMKYFNGLWLHLVGVDRLLKDGARLAYVVGCSEIKGVYVETDVLLARLIERLSPHYKVTEIRRLRRRHSGVNLHESVVYAEKHTQA